MSVGGATQLREFQREVLELAREQNVVMVGDTGIGKTFVAIALLSEQDYAHDKRAFFMAPTRQLVIQIASKVQLTSTLACRAYYGQELDLWDEHQWASELHATRVLVCTPEIVRNIIEKGYVTMNRINLLVFDECHHVTKRHPYAQLMKMYDASDAENMPRIFGATACPTKECAERLHATLKKVELNASEIVEYAAAAPIVFDLYPTHGHGGGSEVDSVQSRRSESASMLQAELSENMNAEEARVCAMLWEDLKEVKLLQVYDKLLKKGRSKSVNNEAGRQKLIRKFVRSCFAIYRNLGAWCYYRFVELEIERRAMSTSLLIAVPGNMFGLDKDAVATLLLLQAKRHNCRFAATSKVAKIEELIRSRLLNAESETASEEDAADDDEMEELDDSSARAADFLMSALGNKDGESNDKKPQKGIVFVHTRTECRVLYEYLNEKLAEEAAENSESDDEGSGEELAVTNICGCMLGQATMSDTAASNLPTFQQTLSDFEAGVTRVLISTSVSAEGVDFPLCSLIVVSDRINTSRMLMQLRGRARHEDGVVYYLAEEGDLDHKIHYKQLLLEAEAINGLDFSHDKQESILSLPRTVTAEKLLGHPYTPDLPKVVIESTGATLDLDSSVQCINQFCQALPENLFTVNYKDMYSFTESKHGKIPIFKVKLHLPPELDIAPFESEFMMSKGMAKASAALLAGRSLWERGLLDDSLNSIYRKMKGSTARNNQNLGYFLGRINQ
ncbi:Dicer-like [Globisporangium polare]